MKVAGILFGETDPGTFPEYLILKRMIYSESAAIEVARCGALNRIA